MPIACPACGKTTGDAAACNHCGADVTDCPMRLPPKVCPLPPGPIELSDDQRVDLADPEIALWLTSGDQTFRVRWLDADVAPETREAFDRRRASICPALPALVCAEEPVGVWAIAPATPVTEVPWLAFRGKGPIERLAGLVDCLAELAQLAETLHASGAVWMNFQPGEWERDSSGSLRIRSLDLRVFPTSETPERVTVHRGYLPPEVARLRAEEIGPRVDVFHLGAFGYYWLAGRLPAGLPGGGLEACDYWFPLLRIYAPDVPEGVASVLERATSTTPSDRQATPSALVAELRDALERARARRAFAGTLGWDLGHHCRTGRAKTALRRGNEDQALVRRHEKPDRALCVVADGITTCDVGSGSLASLIATIVLENHLGQMSDPANEFRPRIRDACVRASRTIVDWALEKGHADALRAGRDLMGTTLTLGWLQGRTLRIANLGDSRVYLCDASGTDVLTVDGDLASDLLAQGTPPEAVLRLGVVSKSLRTCIGGCDVSGPDPEILLDACVPQFSEWNLAPGDVVILCSDGLVEEGAFLAPDDLTRTLRDHPHASAQELAEILAERADALQRLPSASEPDGFGDNISVVVAKLYAAGP